LFSGWDEHEKSVSVLSGGERRRLALAHVVASGANFLVLDEPTNHLDLESREALEAALESFPGTVLLISHDRALIDAVAERTLAIEDGTIKGYDGGWADYVRRREENAARLSGSEPQTQAPRKEKRRRGARGSEPQTQTGPKRPTELDNVESEIAAREEALADLERKLADDWANVETLQAHRRARDELQSLLGRWEELFEKSQAQ
jgi:ATP-binding cassette subfamily F protein 3